MADLSDVILFAGPSLYGAGGRSALLPDIEWHPPALHGDIDRVVAKAPSAGVIVLCDGVFQSVPAASHAEIARAIDGGWQVWGVSGLGAIRAFEMRDEGMRGFGHVYAQFFCFDDFTDDEMCLLHDPAPSFRPSTEALVNVRYALAHIGAEMEMKPEQQRRLIVDLRALWFGDRTAPRIRSLMVDRLHVTAPLADRFLARLPQYDVQAIDLRNLLNERPWQVAVDMHDAGCAPLSSVT